MSFYETLNVIFVDILQNQIIYLEKVIYVKNVDVTSVKANNGLNS